MQVYFLLQKYLFDVKKYGTRGGRGTGTANFWYTYLLVYSNKLAYLRLITDSVYGSSLSKIMNKVI